MMEYKTMTMLVDWRWMKFGDVIAESQPGFASGQRDPKGVIQLRMNNVDTRGNLVWNEFLRVPAEPSAIEKFRLQLGDIVFNNTNSTELVGKSALFAGHDEPIVYSNHFTRLRVKPDIADPGFVTYWLMSQWQAKTFENICNRWIGQSAVKNDKLFELQIPLLPLTEQQRIAAKLNEQMAAVAQARQAAEEQLRAARELPSAYLREVFEGQAAKKFPQKQLFELCDIQLGKMLSPASKTGVRSRPYLRNFNVQWGYFDLSDVAEMDFGEEQEDRYALASGDLLVCEGGEPGRAAVWDGALNPCYYQKALHRLRPINHSVDTEYVMYRLWLGAIEGEFTNSNAQTTIAHLPKIRLEKLSILVPPLLEQKRLAKQIKEKMMAADTLQKSLEAQLAEINQLPSALLRRAFAGDDPF